MEKGAGALRMLGTRLHNTERIALKPPWCTLNLRPEALSL